MGKPAGSKQGKQGPRPQRKGSAGTPPRGDEDGRSEVEFLPPLRPQPKLLIGLGVVLALWIAFLLVLYFTTVYPHRHKPGERAAPALREASPSLVRERAG
jgi:hypothetical protein